jgi:hypothetical protein
MDMVRVYWFLFCAIVRLVCQGRKFNRGIASGALWFCAIVLPAGSVRGIFSCFPVAVRVLGF